MIFLPANLSPGSELRLDRRALPRRFQTRAWRRRSLHPVRGLRRGKSRRKPLQRKGMRRLVNGEDFSCYAEINGFAKDSGRNSPTRRDVMPFRGVAPLALRQCLVDFASARHRRIAAQIPHLSGVSAARSTANTATANTGCSSAFGDSGGDCCGFSSTFSLVISGREEPAGRITVHSGREAN